MPHYIGEVPNFDQLLPGEVFLGVPIRDGAVLIHGRSEEKKRIAIDIRPELTAVIREDGDPLQILFCYDEYVEGQGYVPATPVTLLDKPLEQMTFTRASAGWSIEEIAPTDERRGARLRTFANIVAQYALRKQKIAAKGDKP